MGYDLRRRGIWSWFEAEGCDLREEAISPGLTTTFPAASWLLGNHSDELTPWVAVMAALSGPTTSYWLLPCCPHSFTAKYQRRDAAKSVFRDYLDWVTGLGEEAGFTVEEDRMRIPSTKRICLVGEPREGGGGVRREQVLELVTRWSGGFRAREKVERVRNCSQLERGLVAGIVARVVELCLQEGGEGVGEEGGEGAGAGAGAGATVEKEVAGSQLWRSGRSLALGDVVRSLESAGVELVLLKSSCGGLQTLLRNHHHIFLVTGGRVRLRRPGTDAPSTRRKGRPAPEGARLRTKPCWHFNNHPDGCPLEQRLCSWSHEIQPLESDIPVKLDIPTEAVIPAETDIPSLQCLSYLQRQSYLQRRIYLQSLSYLQKC